MSVLFLSGSAFHESMTNISNKGTTTNVFPVVKISVDDTCNPYTHQVQSLCFVVPTMVPGADKDCMCPLEIIMNTHSYGTRKISI